VLSYLVLAAITVLIGGIAIRTAVAVGRRQLLPPTTQAPAPGTAGTTVAEPAPALSR